MKRLGNLKGCRKGSTVVEFALVAPVFLAMLFGIIEVSRIFWIKQTLDEVAYSTARCMSVSSTCGDNNSAVTYAVERASGYVVAISNTDIDVTTGTTCKGIADSNSVQITKDIGSIAAGLLPQLPTSVSATACFPVLAEE